jgi:glutamate/aspartate transport system permease protein
VNYHWNWEILLSAVPTGETTYLGWMVSGLQLTLALSLSAWCMALAIGTLMGVLRTVPHRGLPGIAAVYVEVFRNIPLLVQLFIWYFVLPELLPAALGDAVKQTHPAVQQFIAAMVCLGFFTGARVCEQVRAGIQSLPPGQRQAALALGLTLPQTYRHVLMPLAARRMLPPLTSEFLNIFKNSAVCSTIGLLELSAQGRQLVDYTAQPYESFIAVTLLYMLINALVMLGMQRVENRARVPGYLGSGK